MTDISDYFDFAAATPMDSRVFDAMKPYMTDNFFNPSAQYLPSRIVKKTITEARHKVASYIGAKPVEITFTAGGTEANNMAIYGLLDTNPDANVITSAIEHESILEPAKRYNHKICPVLSSGIINVDILACLIDKDTILISVMLANNEIGTIQPIRKISELIKSVRTERLKNGIKTPIYLHTDASQATNYLDLQVHRLGVDLMTLNGGKIYGPKQSGLLYISGGISLKPLIVGGGQERNNRSGTENVANIIGFTKALELAGFLKTAEVARMQELQKFFFDYLLVKAPEAVVNGTLKTRLPNNVHVSFPGQDNERLMMLLDERQIYVAVGSACSASSDEPSHVLSAIGLEENIIRSSLRFSMGRQTTRDSIIKLVDSLSEIIA